MLRLGWRRQNGRASLACVRLVGLFVSMFAPSSGHDADSHMRAVWAVPRNWLPSVRLVSTLCMVGPHLSLRVSMHTSFVLLATREVMNLNVKMLGSSVVFQNHGSLLLGQTDRFGVMYLDPSKEARETRLLRNIGCTRIGQKSVETRNKNPCQLYCPLMCSWVWNITHSGCRLCVIKVVFHGVGICPCLHVKTVVRLWDKRPEYMYTAPLHNLRFCTPPERMSSGLRCTLLLWFKSPRDECTPLTARTTSSMCSHHLFGICSNGMALLG